MGEERTDLVKVGFRNTLSASESVDAMTFARTFASERGVSDPKEGDELYDMGLRIATLARVMVDSESPQEEPEPYFAGGESEMFEALDDDQAEYLFAIWENHKLKHAVRRTKLETGDLVDVIDAMVSDNDERAIAEFSCLRPGMQFQAFRTMCRLWNAAVEFTPTTAAPTPARSPGSSGASPSTPRSPRTEN